MEIVHFSHNRMCNDVPTWGKFRHHAYIKLLHTHRYSDAQLILYQQ